MTEVNENQINDGRKMYLESLLLCEDKLSYIKKHWNSNSITNIYETTSTV